MAQWLGQFSGHTHATRVEDAEIILRHAIEVSQAASPGPGLQVHAKAINRLAQQLLTARLKLMKARIAKAKDAQSGVALALRAGEIAALERKYAILQVGGLDAILREFQAIPGLETRS